MELNPHLSPIEPVSPVRSYAADLSVLVALAAIFFGAIEVGREWHHPFTAAVRIDLSFWMLPYYTLLSFSRGVLAYGISLVFTLAYARWAAYDRQAERLLIPILDVLQSVPFPAFLAPLELLLINIVPNSIFGLELTCVLVIFTGQVWNMTFSFYYSLKNLPPDFTFVGRLARFTAWQRFTRIEIPFATSGLVYNSMVSMAGGWFFLTVIESFSIGQENFRLPGIGSYMVTAQQQGNIPAQIGAVVAMILMIVAVDQLVWRPLIVWSGKFRLEDTEAQFQDSSAMLRWLRRSKLAGRIQAWATRRWQRPGRPRPIAPATDGAFPPRRPPKISWRWFLIALVALLAGYGFYRVVELVVVVPFSEWLTIGSHLLLTLVRVLTALTLGTLWTVPVGVWIGSNPRLARFLMPMTQIAASFPAPMVFPNIVMLIYLVGGNLQWGAVLLMMLGSQWYILFNVIAGASAIPQDLRACSQLMHLTAWQRWRTLLLPGIFPALVTGWITAAGGAWNASIVSEYTLGPHGQQVAATGLGATIAQALAADNLSLLTAAVIVMAFFVVLFNRAVWKRLATLARDRYQLLT